MNVNEICLGMNRAPHPVDWRRAVNDLGYCPDCYDLAIQEASLRLAELRYAALRPQAVWVVEIITWTEWGECSVDRTEPYTDHAAALEYAWATKLAKPWRCSIVRVEVQLVEFARVTK